MAKQILFGINSEGATDYRFLGQLLVRCVPQRLLEAEIDADMLPLLELKGEINASFNEKMGGIEANSNGIHGIFVHMDADSRSERTILENKWKPFVQISKRPTTYIPIIPIRNIESWMLCDTEALSNLFILEGREIEKILAGRKVENISDGKSVLRELANQSGQLMRSIYIQENLGKAVSLEKLQLLSSFVRFQDRLDVFLETDLN